MGELQNTDGQRTGFASACGTPDGHCVINTGPCHKLRLLVYIIPESLPRQRTVGSNPDFNARLKVSADGRKVCDKTVEVSRWGGASAEFCISAHGMEE